jgi:hypothetical protein
MANRIFVSAVVVLWLSSMTWLVTHRLLPTYFGGPPPLTQAAAEGEAVAWQVSYNDQVVGEAASIRLQGTGGTTDLFNRLVLEEFPVMSLAPSVIRMAVGDLGDMTFDVLTRVEFDPLGKFSSFHSRITMSDLASSLIISGRMDDSYLKLRVHSNDFSHSSRVYLPNSQVLNEALSPDAQLPYMHVGKSWQEKVYSPFSSPTDPVERVQAEVKAIELIEYFGEHRRVMRVDYQSVTSSGVTNRARKQGAAWVAPETGRVLRREVLLGGSRLRFERLPAAAAEAIGADLFQGQLFSNALTHPGRVHPGGRNPAEADPVTQAP